MQSRSVNTTMMCPHSPAIEAYTDSRDCKQHSGIPRRRTTSHLAQRGLLILRTMMSPTLTRLYRRRVVLSCLDLGTILRASGSSLSCGVIMIPSSGCCTLYCRFERVLSHILQACEQCPIPCVYIHVILERRLRFLQCVSSSRVASSG